MSDLKGIYINMLVLGILTFAIMGFVITLQSQNDVDTGNKILNNSIINQSYGDFETTLESTKSSSEDALNEMEDVPPSESIGDLDVSSTISATRSATRIIKGLWNTYTKLPIILGIPPIISKVLTSLLILLIIIGIWAIWKGAISQ